MVIRLIDEGNRRTENSGRNIKRWNTDAQRTNRLCEKKDGKVKEKTVCAWKNAWAIYSTYTTNLCGGGGGTKAKNRPKEKMLFCCRCHCCCCCRRRHRRCRDRACIRNDSDEAIAIRFIPPHSPAMLSQTIFSYIFFFIWLSFLFTVMSFTV